MLPLANRGLGISLPHDVVSQSWRCKGTDIRSACVPRYTGEQKHWILTLLTKYCIQISMKFTFSSKFMQHLYARMLRDIAAEIETYRLISGVTVRELMADLHISHAIIKSC